MAATTLVVTSKTFKEGELIPSSAAHGAVGGDNRSPQLSWTAGPEGTKSYAVTCWDPDAPTTVGFTHWVRFDIPADQTSLDEGAGSEPGVHGLSDWGESTYGGMAPPAGDSPHHYQFTVYALDEEVARCTNGPNALITSRAPDDLKAFCHALTTAFAATRPSL